VAGGAGFGKDVWIGGVLYVSGSQVVTTATIGEVFADTLQTVSDRGFTTTNQIYVANTSVSESTSTGALVVDGGVGIGQDLWVGGDIYIGKSIYLGDSLVITTSSFQENVTETLQSVTNRGNSTTNSIFIIGGFGENSNTSTFNSVLSFDNSYSDIARGPNKIKLFDDSVWQGGFGISYDSLDIYSGRNTNFYQDKTAENTGSLVLSISTSSVRIWNTTQTTATNTGALIVDGGVSIGGNLWVNETIYSRGLQVVTTASLGGLGVGVIFAGTDTALDNNYGIVTIWSTATLESVTSRGSTTTHIIRIENATNSTSSDSGALTVGGGVGIAQDLWVGGDIYVGGATVVTTSSFETNINETLQSVTNRGNTTTNIIRVANTTSSTSSDTGALTVGGGVGIGGDLHIGNQLFVEGAATFRGNVTFSGTSTFVYSTSTLYTDNFIDLHFPAGEGANSGVWTVDDGFDIGHIYHHYKEGTGDEHGALIWHNESDELRWYMGGTEYVGGSQIWSFTSATFGVFRTGAIRLENTETSISTTTGALQVIGGVGIGGDLNVGGRVDGGGVRTTSSTTAPENPTIGDMWYDTTNEVLLRYTDVGTGVFWLDLTGPVYNFGTTSTFNPNPIVLTPTYNFGTIPSSINEGSTGTFNVITSNISNGTTLYWRLNKTNSSNADFHAISGSFTITDDEGSFDVETVADSITEGEEQFTVSIKTGSETGPTVATSNSITINDTSVFIGRSLYTPGGNAKDVGPFLTGTLPYAIGSNTFTWEAWIKPTSKTNNAFPGIFDLRTNGLDNSGWGLYWESSGSNDLNLRDGSTSRRFVSGITLNQWSHVAVTRVSGQLRAYVNGVLKTGPHTVTNDYTRTLFYIGATFDTYSMEGYITNIRLVVGNALYSGNTYTVPTKPLAAITDTVFLLTADTTATYITDTGPNNIAITNNSAGNSDVISWYNDTPFV
jgi:hypothetical protein